MKKLILILIFILLLVSCSKKEKEIIFATDATWPPMQFISEDGQLVGFEVDLVYEISKALNKNYKVKNIPWATIFAGLKNNNYSAVASTVTITDERKKVLNFCDPILNIGQVIIIKKGNKDIKNENDLKDKNVGVQIGTTADIALDDIKAIKKQYEDIAFALLDMDNGNLDACVCDSLVASDFILKNKKFKDKFILANPTPFTKEEIAIAVNPDDVDLIKDINDGLKKIKENGVFTALKKKWNIL